MVNEIAIRKLLTDVMRQRCTVEEAVNAMRTLPFEAVEEFAKIDHHRTLRRGRAEAVYCAGKTPEQTAAIFECMAKRSAQVLGTKAGPEHHAAVVKKIPEVKFDAVSRCLWIDPLPPLKTDRAVGLIAAGTSDLPVAEEAAKTLAISGYGVERIYDIGVAGLHRLLAYLPQLRAAPVLIVCAGMEGALPSVVAGLVAAPVIAVPTAIGYGTSFGGVAALLGMLNSCSPGIAVMNIDNGFGAAYLAVSIMDAIGSQKPPQ